MQGALMVIIFILPGGQYNDTVSYFPSLEICKANLLLAHKVVKQQHTPQAPYVVGCFEIVETPKGAI